MFLQDYDLMWDNCPGSQMGPADALSRFDVVDTLLNNTIVTMLSTIPGVLNCALDVELADKIIHFTTTNLLVRNATDAMPKHTSLFPCAFYENWTFLNSVLYFKGCLYVPEPACQNLVHSLHYFPVEGHGGYFHTIHLVQHDYW